jgi:hypothetical protein
VNEQEEAAYTLGSRAAWKMMLNTCLQMLGHDAPDVARLISEREETIALLRSECAEWGDNDWDSSLHLTDILSKHLFRHLE